MNKSISKSREEIRKGIRECIGNHLEVCYAVEDVLSQEETVDALINAAIEEGLPHHQLSEQWADLEMFMRAMERASE